MRKILSLLIILSLTFVFASCSGGGSVPSLHNDSLGTDLTLGMSKESIDEQFGSPIVKDGGYYYTDYMLAVKYFDGKAVSFFTNDAEWSIFGNKMGHARDAVVASLGEPSVPNSCLYAYDNQWNLTKTKDDIIYYVFFACDDSNHVSGVTIQRADSNESIK